MQHIRKISAIAFLFAGAIYLLLYTEVQLPIINVYRNIASLVEFRDNFGGSDEIVQNNDILRVANLPPTMQTLVENVTKVPAKVEQKDIIKDYSEVIFFREVMHTISRNITNISPFLKNDKEQKNKNENRRWLNSPQLRVMATRQAVARNTCDHLRGVNHKNEDWGKSIDLQHHFTYCKIGKAASSSMMAYIGLLNERRIHWKPGMNLRNGAFSVLEKPTAAKKHLKTLLLTIVRHPFNRLVSAYRNKILNTDYYKQKVQIFKIIMLYKKKTTQEIISEYLSNIPWKELPTLNVTNIKNYKTTEESLVNMKRSTSAPNLNSSEYAIPDRSSGTPSFRDFFLYVVVEVLKCQGRTECLRAINGHIRPQLLLCNPCDLEFDFIMKVETIEKYIKLLSEILHLPNMGPLSKVSFYHTPLKKVPKYGGSSKNNLQITTKKTNPVKKQSIPGKVDGLKLNEIKYKKRTKRFIELNKTSSETILRKYLATLTVTEMDLFYKAFYQDFIVFGYKPV